MDRPPYPTARLDYELPPELIAQHPPARRVDSRLLYVVARIFVSANNGGHEGPPHYEGNFADRQFTDLPELLPPRTLIYLNDSRVIPARLHGLRKSGGAVELLYVEYRGDGGVITAVVGSNAKLAAGEVVALADGWHAELLEPKAPDGIKVRLTDADGKAPCLEDVLGYLEQHGETPLPPYIRRGGAPAPPAGQQQGWPENNAAARAAAREPQGGSPTDDRERYQTVYARAAGSVAAPTAGLHFTPELLAELESRGHSLRKLTLHVGIGTFAPLRVADLRDHVMHEEAYSVNAGVAEEYLEARAAGRPILAVGTTSLRILHTLLERGSPGPHTDAGEGESARLATRAPVPLTGRTSAFIYPGHGTDAADLLLTNFHLPRSTLLALVYAFGGEALMRSVYAHAVAERYRFFSYGDCMLIDRRMK